MTEEVCPACLGTGEDFNEGDPCHVCRPDDVIGVKYLREHVRKQMEPIRKAFEERNLRNKNESHDPDL